MKRKLFVALVVALFLMVSLTTKAFADFDKIFMTGSYGSTTAQTVFGWNQTPWLYVRLPALGFNVLGSWWQNPNTGDTASFFAGTGPNSSREVWISLNGGQDVNGAPVSWNNVRRAGSWNVDATYFFANNPGNPFGTGSTSFRVNPEPLSAALLLLGGGALAIRQYRKKKLKV